MCPNDDDSFEKNSESGRIRSCIVTVKSDSSKRNKSNTILPPKYQKVDCRRGKGPRNLEIGLIPTRGPQELNLVPCLTDNVLTMCK